MSMKHLHYHYYYNRPPYGYAGDRYHKDEVQVHEHYHYGMPCSQHDNPGNPHFFLPFLFPFFPFFPFFFFRRPFFW
ncbi:hypothetical protein KKC1_25060 [Calderihabitans maritimus]|uniref:Uncharacterized protein n=1 Tax=Calderihabitans maritimus TaxID=1246530 RepID=A0A1Z5HVR9_9FIRM|nr:hypothetical protein KKC1_25060 [Calderihabitans maritimus]